MTQPTERKAWDQQEGEPNEAYARFLVYRNLGPLRTVDTAYKIYAASGKKRKKSERATGQWHDDCAKYEWVLRASAWDVAQLVNAVPEAATTIFKLLNETAKTCLDEIASRRIKPSNFAELKDMVVILAGFISPEVISATINNAGNVEPEKEGNAQGSSA